MEQSGQQHAVRGALGLQSSLLGGVGAIAKARLGDADGLRAGGYAGNLESAFAVGQRAGVGIALNLHQRAGERIAGGGVAHHSADGHPRGFGGNCAWVGLLALHSNCGNQRQCSNHGGPPRSPDEDGGPARFFARSFFGSARLHSPF